MDNIFLAQAGLSISWAFSSDISSSVGSPSNSASSRIEFGKDTDLRLRKQF